MSERVSEVEQRATSALAAARARSDDERRVSPDAGHVVGRLGRLTAGSGAVGLVLGCWLLEPVVGWLICVVGLADLTLLAVGYDGSLRRSLRARHREAYLVTAAAGAASVVRVGELHADQVPTLAMGMLAVLLVVLAFLLSRLRRPTSR